MWGKNQLKEFLENERLAVGSCVYSSSPALVELMGYCDLDFCRIDNEHSWRKDESVENMVRAASISGIVPLLRVDFDKDVIRKALEIGAVGILIPHITDPGQVEEIVRFAKFPPLGSRGIGTLCFSGRWGTVEVKEWIKWSDQEQLLGVMIEDIKAMEHIDDIMAVKNLDYVLFGASDFSISIGRPGEGYHPKVLDALKETIRVANKYGKYVCKGVGYPWVENAKKFIEMGCHMIELGHDATILKTIWSQKGEESRKLQN